MIVLFFIPVATFIFQNSRKYFPFLVCAPTLSSAARGQNILTNQSQTRLQIIFALSHNVLHLFK